MTLNRTMADLLAQIQRNEDTKNTLDKSSPQIGDNLIRLYVDTENHRTRELITLFMIEAGYGWLRKLVTRDTQVLVA